MYILKWFRFIIAKIYNILRYFIARILRHMCNLHTKETEISQKRSKRIKNWKITYSVILSVLSNKTNLILGFSSTLKRLIMSYDLCWGCHESAQIFCFTFINIYKARLSDWTQKLLLANGFIIPKVQCVQQGWKCNLCINENKNIEQRLWSRFLTL